MKSKTNTYSAAGVSIEEGNNLVERIKPVVKQTFNKGVVGGIGGFGGVFDIKAFGYNDPLLVSSTDGVGTKLKIAQVANKHDTIGIDLVAMCVNDIIAQGAKPLYFLDYFACGKLDVDNAEDVIKGIAEGCKQADCALIGGETAEMPGMYQNEDYDLAGFTVGAVERDEILPKTETIEAGDALIGLASSGIHSNGYSLVRKVFKDNGIDFSDKAEFDNLKTYAEVLLTPTKIYVKQCLELIEEVQVKALAHITGGGITENLPRVLNDNHGASIDLSAWNLPHIFKMLQQKADVAQEEMLKTFNCGIGMIIIVKAEDAEKSIEVLKNLGEEAYNIGSINNSGEISYSNQLGA